MIDTQLIAEFMDQKDEFGDLIIEMANLKPEETGLPMVIWTQPDLTKKHGPRIKVQPKHGNKIEAGNWCVVSIDDAPKLLHGKLNAQDLAAVQEFVIKNKELLLQYWNDEITTRDFVNSIEKIEEV